MNAFTHLVLPDIEEMLEKGEIEDLVAATASLHPADLADLLVNLRPDLRKRFFLALPKDVQVDAFEQLEEEEQAELIDLIGVEPLAPVIDEMAPDDRADLAATLPEETLDSILPLLDKEERRDLRKLMAYPQGTAGAIMSTEFARVPEEVTVAEAIDHLRRIASEMETIYYVYVTDAEARLTGVVTLRRLIVADPGSRIAEIMTRDPIAVRTTDDQEEVARAFEHYDFLAMPVVDEMGRLVGIVTHDDVLDVLTEEATEDAQRMGAVSPLEIPYPRIGVLQLTVKRAGWLILLFLGSSLTANVLNHYQGTLQAVAALVIFLPLVISSGGNTGSQSSSLITRALAVGTVEPRDWLRVFWRELRVGVLLGSTLGLIGFTYAVGFFGTPFAVGATVAFTLIGVCTCGAVIGSLIPLGFQSFGFDPAFASSPFIASFVDVTGILVYMLVARAVLGL